MCTTRGTVVQAALAVCCTRVRPRGSGAVQLQTRRTTPIRKRDSRQPAEFKSDRVRFEPHGPTGSLTSRRTTENPQSIVRGGNARGDPVSLLLRKCIDDYIINVASVNTEVDTKSASIPPSFKRERYSNRSGLLLGMGENPVGGNRAGP
jgi:hypothetical protein